MTEYIKSRYFVLTGSYTINSVEHTGLLVRHNGLQRRFVSGLSFEISTDVLVRMYLLLLTLEAISNIGKCFSS